MNAENNYTKGGGSTVITRQPMELGTSEFNFGNSNVASILQPDRKENADCAYGFGFLTCFCCNIPVGLLALLLANQASNKFEEKNYDKGVFFRRLSYLFSFFALLLGITTLVLILTGTIPLL
ncbi:uncharacterized protein [Magallana gigas]|uniref:uncharacterized protein n=1 Tax=Magallana gigas TaxID=29159 RepID=UPI00333E329A